LKHDLPTVSRLRFLLNGLHRPSTLASPAHTFGHKEIAHITGSSPAPTIDTSHLRPVGRSQKKTNEISLGSGRSDVEIIEAFLKKPDALGTRIRLHDQRDACGAVWRACCHKIHYRAKIGANAYISSCFFLTIRRDAAIRLQFANRTRHRPS